MTTKELIEECNLLKEVLYDYQDKTGVDVSRAVDGLSNETQKKILKEGRLKRCH
jgi:hypothetical protein